MKTTVNLETPGMYPDWKTALKVLGTCTAASVVIIGTLVWIFRLIFRAL